MHPILLTLPGTFLKVLALVGVFGGALLAVLCYGVGGKLKEGWLSWAVTGLVGGLILARLMSGDWPFLPATWKADWSPLPIYSYGVMLGLSLFIGWYVAIAMARKDGLEEDQVAACYLVTAASSVIFARVLYVITQWEDFDGRVLDMLNFRRGGLVAYGGFVGFMIGSIAYCRWKGMSMLLWGDSAVLAISLGTSITRFGCLLYGCDYGKVAPTLPWGLRFPEGSPAHADHLRHKLIEAGAALSERVHPTQIYESLVGLSAFLFLLWVRRHRRFAGQVFLAFAIYYGLLRYLIEYFRGDEDRAAVGMFSTSQFIGLLSVAAAAAVYFMLYKRAQKDPAGARSWEALLAAQAAAAADEVADQQVAAGGSAGSAGGRGGPGSAAGSSSDQPPAGQAKKGRR